MKLYDSVGPNPAVVRMFMAEKGIEIPKETVDIRGGENRQGPYLGKNPNGTCPALELDDGNILSEITAICEYLEERQPEPPLIGKTPEERAEARMWARRVDLGILEPMANGFRFGEGLKMFQNRIYCIPEASAGLKETAQKKIAWLDGQLAGKEYICGTRFTLADILLYVFIDFFTKVGQPIVESNKNIVAWHARVAARKSVGA